MLIEYCFTGTVGIISITYYVPSKTSTTVIIIEYIIKPEIKL